MRRFGHIIATVILAAAAAPSTALPPPVPTPADRPAPRPGEADRPANKSVLTFASTRFKFGDIVEDAKPTAHFVFTNTGIEDLKIYEVKPTCGCTLADLRRVTTSLDPSAAASGEIDLTNTEVLPPITPGQPAVFAPGESGVIVIAFDSQGKRGPQNRPTRVYSSTQGAPVRTLAMVGHVDPLVILDPPVINFGRLNKGEIKSQDIWVYGRTEDFEVPRVSSNNDAYTLEVMETEKREYRGEMLRATRIRVSTPAASNAGSSTATLYIRTNDPRRSMVTTTSRSTVLGDLQLSPGLVRLGTVNAGQPFERQVRLINRRGQPFQVLSGELNHPSLQVEVTAEPVSADNPFEYVVTIRGRALRAVPRLTGEILLRTDVAGEEQVRLRYSAVIRPAATPAGGAND